MSVSIATTTTDIVNDEDDRKMSCFLSISIHFFIVYRYSEIVKTIL